MERQRLRRLRVPCAGKARHVAIGQGWQRGESDQPKAGNRHRLIRSPKKGRQGSTKKDVLSPEAAWFTTPPTGGRCSATRGRRVFRAPRASPPEDQDPFGRVPWVPRRSGRPISVRSERDG